MGRPRKPPEPAKRGRPLKVRGPANMKLCSRCQVEQPHSMDFDVCDVCTRYERKRATHLANYERNKLKNRDAVRAYRAKCKETGQIDKSVSPERWDKTLQTGMRRAIGRPRLPREPIPAPMPRRDKADEIAARDSAAQVSKHEKRFLSVEDAAQIELARRELARRKLIHFIKRRNPKYLDGWVHQDICERLEKFYQDVVDGLSPRLILMMPPRHGKSMLCSEEFPAWALGKSPEFQIIATSYSSPLAYDFSRKVQGIINSADFPLLFDSCRIQPGIEAMDLWATTAGGRYCATGVGGPLTGRGSHILLIDDPIKNREEAESSTQRLLIKNWYTSTAYTRLMPGGGVLIIQTRWHDDDLAGWLIHLNEQAEKEFITTGEWPADADRWEVVEYPAIAIKREAHREIGDALHPARYPLSALLRIKRTLGDRDWNALFQQSPVPEEGAYFTKEHLRYYEGAAPHGMSIIAACDLAISKADHANYSVICVVGVDEKDDIYVLDVQRGRWDAGEIVDKLIACQRTWKPQLIGIERTHVEQAIGPFLEKRITEEKLWGMAVEPLNPGKRDKQLRAKPIQGRMRQGKVLLPKGRSFLEWFVPELLRFPNGVHDDGVDAIAWIGQMMNMVQYTPPTKPQHKSWKDRLDALLSSSPTLRNPSMAA